MNSETTTFNEFKPTGEMPSGSQQSSEHLFSILQGIDQKPHLIHKLKRIIFELRYLETNISKFNLLTGREKEIITLVVMGYNNPGISERLFISRRTVEQHRKNINRKLETNSLPEICIFAYAFDLV